MAHVITFSRQFPSYHPRAGQPTYFVEKVWCSLLHHCGQHFEMDIPDLENELANYWEKVAIIPKHHTIRAGHRFKVGDWFSPRVWSGKPYRSKQIIIAPDIQVKKTWDVDIDEADVWAIGLPGTQVKYLDDDQQARIAMNDGLTEQDLYWWFKEAKKPFDGQIISWNENINY